MDDHYAHVRSMINDETDDNGVSGGRPTRLMVIGPTHQGFVSTLAFKSAYELLGRHGFKVEVPVEVTSYMSDIDADVIDELNLRQMNLGILATVDGIAMLPDMDHHRSEVTASRFLLEVAKLLRIPAMFVDQWVESGNSMTRRRMLMCVPIGAIHQTTDAMNTNANVRWIGENMDLMAPFSDAAVNGEHKSDRVGQSVNDFLDFVFGDDAGMGDIGQDEDEPEPERPQRRHRQLGLSDLTINAVRAEAIRAHVKHHRPDENSGSLLDDGLTILARLAALMEEVGEVAEELIPAINMKFEDDPLFDLIVQMRIVGKTARRLTYDGGGEPGLTAVGPRVLPVTVDRTKLVKELIQVANVALSWVEHLEGSGSHE